jgi:hypothetical protein
MAVRIYQKIENNMQRGRLNGKGWLLEHEVPYACKADPLTGWQGSGDTRGQITLSFPSLEAAIGYAEREGLAYHIFRPGTRSVATRNYADNFTAGPPLDVGRAAWAGSERKE